MSVVVFQRQGQNALRAHGFHPWWTHGGGSCLVCDSCNSVFLTDTFYILANARAIWGFSGVLDVSCCGRLGALDIKAITQTSSISTVGIATASENKEPVTLEEYAVTPGDGGQTPTSTCRWCKGKGEITVNFKTRPCECVAQPDVEKESATTSVTPAVGVGWKVKHEYHRLW